MILISAGLVLTAVVLLIAGVVLGRPPLVIWSIAVSMLSAVFLVIGALLRRHELFPGGGRAGAVPPSPHPGTGPAGPVPAPPMASHPQRIPAGRPATPHGTRQTAATPPRPAPAGQPGVLDAESIVLVIPGRRRYHVAGCRQLAGREYEELTHEEARAEGFTPCTTCLPEFTAGLVPQDAPAQDQEAQGPARPPQTAEGQGSPASFAEQAPPAASRPASPEPVASRQISAEPAVSEATARFAPPYGSATPSAAPAFPVQAPTPPAPPAEDSAATSWFSRDIASSAATAPKPGPGPERGTEPVAAPEPGAAEPGAAEPEAAESGVTESGPGEPMGSPSDIRPQDEDAEDTEDTKDAENAEDTAFETVVVKPPVAEPQGPAARSSVAESAAVRGDAAEQTGPSEPVEPAETAPGRAGQPVSAGPTLTEEPTARTASPDETGTAESPETGRTPSAAEKDVAEAPADDDRDTSPGGIPAVVVQEDENGASPEDDRPADRPAERPGMVKVIMGTRRFHGTACPLIRGVDDDGLQTMSRAEAERSGLSACSVCQ
ncbi:hypothetical protein GCM10010156_10780 [Planobispora rosea]|uniref:Uncharacterized protein n=1 Tax=Planobispora rosea TaxID=35762 RepID=A0A8J3RWU3_PLARO|nr:hypothetical protein GCM10010156_10780 [Planobispora rosea]GIH82679.1 hypothetical protein Pro02_10870 [Planobispora rosea]